MFRSRSVAVRMLLLMFALSVGLAACKSTTPRKHWWEFWKPKAPATSTIYPDDSALQAVEPPGAKGLAEGAIGEPPAPSTEARASHDPAGMIAALKTVYFAYDSAEINPTEQQALNDNAEWLKANPAIVVQIEGHCDERGTPEYNLNLGQRRANAVRDYLVAQGVAAERLMTISYGEERPVDTGQSEQSYQLNRRAQFMVYE